MAPRKPLKADAVIATIRGVLGTRARSRAGGGSMAWFFMRRQQRLTRVVSVQYFLDGVVGEGIIDGLSLSGGYMNGNIPVSVGMVLALQMLVPGDSEPLLIDRATVVWVKGSEFGVYFDTPKPKVVERITTVISTLIKTQHDSFRYG